jgi:hypothetical protein
VQFDSKNPKEKSTLAGYRNSGKGEEYRTPHGLPKDLRRGKNAEEQHIFHLATGLIVGVSGDDLVVVHQAFFVDESLNNDRIVTVRNAFSKSR